MASVQTICSSREVPAAAQQGRLVFFHPTSSRQGWRDYPAPLSPRAGTRLRPKLTRCRPNHSAALGYVARGLGQHAQARTHLCQALRTATEMWAFEFLLATLPPTALLLVDCGQAERAVELYALASRPPYVANSRWFEDVAGKKIAAVAATLSPNVVAAAQARGRARDLDATVKELLAELGDP